jgi:hypothetical protein
MMSLPLPLMYSEHWSLAIICYPGLLDKNRSNNKTTRDANTDITTATASTLLSTRPLSLSSSSIIGTLQSHQQRKRSADDQHNPNTNGNHNNKNKRTRLMTDNDSSPLVDPFAADNDNANDNDNDHDATNTSSSSISSSSSASSPSPPLPTSNGKRLVSLADRKAIGARPCILHLDSLFTARPSAFRALKL